MDSSSVTRHPPARVILWDIDGTLVRSHRPGQFTKYFAPALQKVFGASGGIEGLSVSGMTDMQIALESLREHGYTHEGIRARFGGWSEVFMREMRRVVIGEEPFFYALPGARAALEATARSPHYANTLLTGNIEPAARLKLELVGLESFFRLPGAFGDDSHDRRDLPAIARRRLEEHFDSAFAPSQLIVIGDTPNDIACARHFGCRAVAVATGRGHNVEALTAHNPDAILPDLSDTKLLMKTLDSL